MTESTNINMYNTNSYLLQKMHDEVNYVDCITFYRLKNLELHLLVLFPEFNCQVTLSLKACHQNEAQFLQVLKAVL